MFMAGRRPALGSDYAMYSWISEPRPAATFSTDSAPPRPRSEPWRRSRSVGAAQRWTMAPGAVSHTGDVGLMGVTLVDVDNR